MKRLRLHAELPHAKLPRSLCGSEHKQSGTVAEQSLHLPASVGDTHRGDRDGIPSSRVRFFNRGQATRGGAASKKANVPAAALADDDPIDDPSKQSAGCENGFQLHSFFMEPCTYLSQSRIQNAYQTQVALRCVAVWTLSWYKRDELPKKEYVSSRCDMLRTT